MAHMTCVVMVEGTSNGPQHDLGMFSGSYIGNVISFPWVGCIWVVVKIMVPFWVPIIIRHLIFRVPKKGP